MTYTRDTRDLSFWFPCTCTPAVPTPMPTPKPTPSTESTQILFYHDCNATLCTFRSENFTNYLCGRSANPIGQETI